jgi:hypothetical protein
MGKKYIKNVARKHQSQGGFIQNFCVGPGFAIVLSLLVKTMAKFLHEYTNKFGGLFSIKKQTSNVLDGTIFLQLGAM